MTRNFLLFEQTLGVAACSKGDTSELVVRDFAAILPTEAMSPEQIFCKIIAMQTKPFAKDTVQLLHRLFLLFVDLTILLELKNGLGRE